MTLSVNSKWYNFVFESTSCVDWIQKAGWDSSSAEDQGQLIANRLVGATSFLGNLIYFVMGLVGIINKKIK